MKTKLRLHLCVGTAVALTVLMVTSRSNAQVPSWWTSGGVLNTNATANDYAPVTQGQVKNVAYQAFVEMSTNLIAGGAGAALTNLINSFSPTNNYLLANIGQLKSVAQPFYDRLIAVGYTNAYPWAGTTSTNDYLAANIGQLKYLFSWDLAYDSVGDGIPDWWRAGCFGGNGTTTNSESCTLCDPFGTGYGNLEVYVADGIPADYSSSALGPPECFTNVFSTNITVIAIQPATNDCIFYANESVIITSAAPIEVDRLTYGGQTSPVTNSGPSLTLTMLAPGHYFVQSGNDRAEFAVFPSDYRTLDNVGHDDDFSEEFNDLSDRAKLGWVRVLVDWGVIQTNEGAAFNWGALSNGVYQIPRLTNYFGKANIIVNFDHADWAFSYSFSRWLTDFTNFVAAAYAQYGTNSSIAWLDALSEVSDGAWNTNFNVAGNYSALATQVYQAVSVAWPGLPQTGPSESSPGSPIPTDLGAIGADAYLAAVDYHDYYNGYGNSIGDPDDPAFGVVAGRAGLNLAELGTTNIFVTELGLLGNSSLGYPNDPSSNYCDIIACTAVDSLPPYSWYRGLTRAMRTAVLYAQYRAVVLIHSFASGGAEDTTGIDVNGIKPKTSAFLMASYWLNGSTPITNWVSGDFHFAESVWSNGKTNTFVWATEGTSVTTNLGVSVTDVWSNQWTGAIGEEPVIAWGWAEP